MNKAELRQYLRQARLEMSDAARVRKSRQIVEKLKTTMEWSQVKTVHYFEPLHELMEVDTSGFVTYLEDNHPGIQLFAPRLIEGKWEMVTIKKGTAPERFDVVIVPMLGFDKRLHRIGYGGGYYDKFLATQTNAQKIGVCFEQGKVDAVPAEGHDIALDKIVTEQKVYG